MGTGLPFLLEITLLVIGLPLAFAWLLALAGLASLPMGGLLKRRRSALHPRSTSSPEH